MGYNNWIKVQRLQWMGLKDIPYLYESLRYSPAFDENHWNNRWRLTWAQTVSCYYGSYISIINKQCKYTNWIGYSIYVTR